MARRSPIVIAFHSATIYVNDMSMLGQVLAHISSHSGKSSCSQVTGSGPGSVVDCRSSASSTELFDIFSDSSSHKSDNLDVGQVNDMGTQTALSTPATRSVCSSEAQTVSVSCSEVGVGTDMTGDMISGLEHALNKAAEKFVYFSPVTDCIVECNASPADLVKAYKDRSARWADIPEPESERCDSSTCAPQDAVCSPVGTSEALSDVHLHKKKRGNKKK
eukprot:TRINITY_DN25306_c0_g1_i4.p1 TRINITY_DN25306_c0_g1~~TRINITY_DN25306_c0_g1_i4.p1  ORF type:complete len:219 (-),score=29.95 TRINITY_DN25306_c0_g1_i4:256-912(-)